MVYTEQAWLQLTSSDPDPEPKDSNATRFKQCLNSMRNTAIAHSTVANMYFPLSATLELIYSKLLETQRKTESYVSC